MRPDPLPRNDARGVALVAALLVMLAISIIATALMMTVQTNKKLSALEVRETQALRLAEAGVAEAVARLRRGDIADQGNPRMVAQIFLASTGNLPPIGLDSIAVPTGQPAGAWLTYSTPTSSPDALTIEYKTDRSSRILRYDGDHDPPVQTHTGSAIFRITSTGRKGEARRRIVTEVTQRAFDLQLQGAIAAGSSVGLQGRTVVCGFNHRIDTPSDTGEDGQTGAGGCNENAGLEQWQTGQDHLPGIWCAGGISLGPDGRAFGAPPELGGQSSPDDGPWEVFSMDRDEFRDWVGHGQRSEPHAPQGLVHLDDNSTPRDRSGSFSLHSGDGSGFLYVDGDLTLSGTFSYRGFIYVEGELKVNGDAWILGAVVARGGVRQRPGSRLTVLHSRDAVGQCVPRGRDRMVFLSWREGSK